MVLEKQKFVSVTLLTRLPLLSHNRALMSEERHKTWISSCSYNPLPAISRFMPLTLSWEGSGFPSVTSQLHEDCQKNKHLF